MNRLQLLAVSWCAVGAAIATIDLIGYLVADETMKAALRRSVFAKFGTRRIWWIIACFYVLDTIGWPVVVYWNLRDPAEDHR